MKPFWLERVEDESGVSGVGRVAEGVIFQWLVCNDVAYGASQHRVLPVDRRSRGYSWPQGGHEDPCWARSKGT